MERWNEKEEREHLGKRCGVVGLGFLRRGGGDTTAGWDAVTVKMSTCCVASGAVAIIRRCVLLHEPGSWLPQALENDLVWSKTPAGALYVGAALCGNLFLSS
jgi:hypothetical protein